MKVSRLEIFGFKSFLERFVLEFDKNMIGIVGPNGCGKSNVVDALRWVLGETYAKQLRGGSFEDLIFNGTDNKRPLGMAEVSLTIQPDSSWDKRLLAGSDVSDALSKIEQLESTLDILNPEFSNAESEESGTNIENQELSSNNSNKEENISLISKRVLEIPGILDVSEIQFTRRLYRSGESEYFINKIPCRLRDLQDVYRMIGLGARGLSIVQQGQIGQFISKKPLERRELLEEAAGISGFRTKMEAASRRLDKTNDNLNRANDIIIEVQKQVKSLKRQAERAMSRQTLKDELYNIDKEFFLLKSSSLLSKYNSKNNEQIALEAELEIKNSHVESFEANIAEIDANLHDAEVTILELRREKDSHARNLHEEETKLQNIKLKISNLNNQVTHIDEKIFDNEQRLSSISSEIIDLDKTVSDIDSKIQLADDNKNKQSDLIQNIKDENQQKIQIFIEDNKNSVNSNQSSTSTSDKIIEIQSNILKLEEELLSEDNIELELRNQKSLLKSEQDNKFKIEKKLNILDSEKIAIDKQIETRRNHALNAIGIKDGDKSSEILLSLIEVSKEHEKALNSLLGERAQYILSNSPLELLEDYISINDSVRKKTGVISFDNKDYTIDDLPDGNTNFINLLKFKENNKGYINSVLGYSFLSDNIENAKELIKLLESRNINNYSIVLPNGEIINNWGWYTTKGEDVHLSFVRRKSELEAEINSLTESLNKQVELLKEQEELVNNIEIKLSEQRTKKNTLHNLQKELSSLLKLKSEEEKKILDKLRQDERNLRDQLQVIENKELSILREIEKSILEFNASKRATLSQKDRLEKEILIIKETLSSLEEKKARTINELDEVNSQINSEVDSVFSQTIDELKLKIKNLELLIEEKENIRLDFQKSLGDIKFEQSEIRRSRESIEKSLRGVISEVDRSKIELDMLCEEFSNKYTEDSNFNLPSDIENIISSYPDINSKISSLLENSLSLRKRLEKEGEVDPDSIELYEKEKERLNSMTTQIEDLRGAKETLEKTIRQLRELSRIRFVETFTAVNDKFKELVPRLFAGGSGHLELINPEDPLQSGVSIIVRPPGKKITTMELMSGGEKALVATAVLVAMFLHHPGPICVLDEVDAPLDDANLGRFLSLIREISDKTQFLIITHNKLTMQSVDRLIGITMQERGVTTALTVNLEEAEEEISSWIKSAA